MKKYIITIGRELGSGGRTIGKLVAQQLGINYYDYEIIDETAKKSGFSIDFVKNSEQRVTNSLLYNLAIGATYSNVMSFSKNEAINLETQLYLVQQNVIKEMADKGSCVIVGRCADYILRDYENLFRIFVYADKKIREENIIKNYGYKPEIAAKELKKADKRRGSHYYTFTDQHWGRRENYDLMINSGFIGIEKSAELIINTVKDLYNI